MDEYVPVGETRRRVEPRILCVRCLVRSEKDRLVCRDCVAELDALRVKRMVGGEGPRGGSSLAGVRPLDMQGTSDQRPTGSGGWRGGGKVAAERAVGVAGSAAVSPGDRGRE